MQLVISEDQVRLVQKLTRAHYIITGRILDDPQGFTMEELCRIERERYRAREILDKVEKTSIMPGDCYETGWVDAMEAGITDGHWYRLTRSIDKRAFLQAWPDDGSGAPEDADPDDSSIVDVSDTAFSSPLEQFYFASELSALFPGVDAIKLIKCMRG